MNDATAGIVFILGLSALIAVILVAVIWQVSKTTQVKTATEAIVAQEAAYRTLAERATAAQQTIAEEHQQIAADLADLRARVASIEKLLREVD